MGEYEKFMKLLHDKGHVDKMNRAINMSSLHIELTKKHIDYCVMPHIGMVAACDPEFKEAFDKAACEIMIDKVLNDLNLKQDEKFKPTEQDLFLKSLVDSMLTNLFRK